MKKSGRQMKIEKKPTYAFIESMWVIYDQSYDGGWLELLAGGLIHQEKREEVIRLKEKRPPTNAQKRTQMLLSKHIVAEKEKDWLVWNKEQRKNNVHKYPQKIKAKRFWKGKTKLYEVEEDDEAELKKYLVIKKDKYIAIDVIPLATKPPVIIDYKLLKEGIMGNPQQDLEDQGVIDSGCSRHLTGNMSYLTDFEEIGGGYVAFGGNPKRGKITGRGIKREFSVAGTPQQNGVAERKNRTLIEVARIMLVDSKLPTTFWAEVVNDACYVQNKVLVTKPHNKTPYELFLRRKPALGFMRPFGCPVTIFNTIDHIGKFDGKADEVFFVGYSINSKAFRVFNNRTRIVEENLHVQFSENTPNIIGSAKGCDDADDEKKVTEELEKEGGDPRTESKSNDQEKEDNVNSTNNVNIVSSIVNAPSTNKVNDVGGKTSIELPIDPNMPPLEDIVYSDDDEDVGAEADMNNLDAFMPVSPIPTTRVHKDHPVEQIIGDLNSAPQTRRMTKNLEEHGLFSYHLGKTVYRFVDKVYPFRAPRLKGCCFTGSQFHLYCGLLLVAGSVIQTIQDGECLRWNPMSVSDSASMLVTKLDGFIAIFFDEKWMSIANGAYGKGPSKSVDS
ncbi:retrovirus-related pol polyprotein from transposon TNT 1-94 [Tanacetum coccineum]